MYVARMICSDPGCAERAVVEADEVLELVSLLCECGCTMEIVGLPDHVDDVLPDPVALHPRPAFDGLDLAA
jgi:hypothetical protein